MAKLTDNQILHVRSMGKALQVTAIFTNDEDANFYMERHPNEAVVACFGNLVLVADKYDQGMVIADAGKLRAALARAVPWLGKLIADKGHLNSVAPNDAIGALQQAEAALSSAPRR